VRNLSFCCCFLLLVVPCPAQAACASEIPGDVSSDCTVNLEDFAFFAGNWREESPTGPNQLWVATYDGPTGNSDGAAAITIDDAGNAYVTGYSYCPGDLYCDYTTIKYDSDGNQVWRTGYDGDANKSDAAAAIAIDRSRNIYVTGYSEGSGTSADYTTIKYDPNGVQVWAARYNGQGNGFDEATALVIDDSCNVYVTGYSYWSYAADYDYITIKYDPNGRQFWRARYNGPGSNRDQAYDIAIDDSCNVYVTGYSCGVGTFWDYTTVKYDPNGQQVWLARYNAAGNGCEAAYALAIGDACNVYVTGYAYSSDVNYYDYATIKYDPCGNQIWVSMYNGPASYSDEAYDIALDEYGGVYVTGRSWGGSTDFDYATIKYDADGNEVWAARYDGSAHDRDEPAALVVTDSNYVYVTGCSEGFTTSGDYATVKYDGDGNEVWAARYNGPGDGWDDAYAMAIDSLGNVYVTGCSDGVGPNRDYATIKYSVQGLCLMQIAGDLNADCIVDLRDLAIIAAHWLE
jgi:hypothetical protein